MTSRSEPGTDERVSVLIVGGSLVGLSTALFLRLHGVECLAVERHASTAIHPRAGHFQLRTVEILRVGWAWRSGPAQGPRSSTTPTAGSTTSSRSPGARSPATSRTSTRASTSSARRCGCSSTRTRSSRSCAPAPRSSARRLRYRVECARARTGRRGRDGDAARSRRRRRDVGALASTSSPPTATAAPPASGWGSRCAATACSLTASRSTSAPRSTSRRCSRDATRASTTSPTRCCGASSGSTGRATAGFLVVNLVGDTARPEIVAAYPSAPWANVAETIDEQRALELLRAAIGVPEIPVVIEDIATVAGGGRQRRALPGGPRVPGRRRRAHDAAQRRVRRQHRRPGRPQPRVEAGVRASGAWPARAA